MTFRCDSPALTADALRAPLAGGHLLARGEEQAELLGRVPRPPLALRAGLAVEEALGDAVAHLEVDQLPTALALGVARHAHVVVWRLFLSGRRLEITKPGSLLLRSLYGPLLRICIEGLVNKPISYFKWPNKCLDPNRIFKIWKDESLQLSERRAGPA